VVVIVLAARGQGGPSGSNSGTPHQVRYEVTGDTDGMTADMTFEDAGANTAQQNGDFLPWTYTLTASPGAFLYVSAQNQGDSGAITCTIYVDDQVAQTSTSSGGYAICQASGKL